MSIAMSCVLNTYVGIYYMFRSFCTRCDHISNALECMCVCNSVLCRNYPKLIAIGIDKWDQPATSERMHLIRSSGMFTIECLISKLSDRLTKTIRQIRPKGASVSSGAGRARTQKVLSLRSPYDDDDDVHLYYHSRSFTQYSSEPFCGLLFMCVLFDGRT